MQREDKPRPTPSYGDVLQRASHADLAGDIAGRGAAHHPATPASPSEVTVIRRDQASLDARAQEAFKNAVRFLVQQGTYRQLVMHHLDMRHRMHTPRGGMGHMPPANSRRFLAWHRCILREFEKLLLQAHAVQGGEAADLNGVPYWRWGGDDSFPAWLEGFLPETVPPSNAPAPARRPGRRSRLPGAADIRDILASGADPAADPDTRFVQFSLTIEGKIDRPDGTRIAGHDHVHEWVGGVMGIPMSAPIDPVFWLLHAEVDRLWHQWQQANPDAGPALSCEDAVLDPWRVTVAQMADITALGYRYENPSA